MIAATLALLLAQLPPVAQSPPPAPPSANERGRTAYLQRCAACHGTDLRGGPNAPSLRGVGAADVDFWVGTGRMPAAVPWIEVGHRGAQLPQATIDAIVAYVSSVQPSGMPIPVVFNGGDLDRGRALFRENCQHCHGVDARGAAIGGRQWAPILSDATVTQVAEAVRLGPEEMPAFGERQLPDRDLDDIIAYLSAQRASAGFEGLPLASSGRSRRDSEESEAVRAAVFVALTLSGTLLATACAKSNPQASELTSAATSAPDPPSSPLPMGNIAEGRAVFALNCATCHGATGVEGGVGPSLRDERERKNYDATIAWIKNPLPPMPKLYPSLLTESAVDDVAAYIQSL